MTLMRIICASLFISIPHLQASAGVSKNVDKKGAEHVKQKAMLGTVNLCIGANESVSLAQAAEHLKNGTSLTIVAGNSRYQLSIQKQKGGTPMEGMKKSGAEFILSHLDKIRKAITTFHQREKDVVQIKTQMAEHQKALLELEAQKATLTSLAMNSAAAPAKPKTTQGVQPSKHAHYQPSGCAAL